MRTRALFVFCVVACFLASQVLAQEAAEPPTVELIHVKGPLHAIRCLGQVHAIASVGEDGVLLVDTGYQATAEALRDVVRKLTDQPIRIIVNTHGDGDHSGGNAVLGENAVIIAHEWVRQQMGSYFSLPQAAVGGLPAVTVTRPTTLYFNGEEIRLLPVPGGHTGGDMVVVFTGTGAACIGDLVLDGQMPNADPARNGNAQRLAEVIHHLVEVLPPETRVLAAHGRDADHALNLTLDDLAAYAGFVDASLAAVRREMAAGWSLTEIQDAEVLADPARSANLDPGRLQQWTAEVFAGIVGAGPLSICAPFTEVLMADGIDAAVARYRELSASQPTSFDFGENQLNMLGYQLLQRGMIDEAIVVLELNVEIYPESFNPHDSLGEAYMTAGRDQEAIASYERSLELNPDNANGAAMLARIRGGDARP